MIELDGMKTRNLGRCSIFGLPMNSPPLSHPLSQEPHSRPSFHQIVERLRVMVRRNTCITDRHSNNTTCSEESDELEAALRAQKRTAGEDVAEV